MLGPMCREIRLNFKFKLAAILLSKKFKIDLKQNIGTLIQLAMFIKDRHTAK
jgi:hypothetical protein